MRQIYLFRLIPNKLFRIFLKNSRNIQHKCHGVIEFALSGIDYPPGLWRDRAWRQFFGICWGNSKNEQTMKLRKQSKKGSTSQNTPVLEKFVVKITNQENTSFEDEIERARKILKKPD